MRAGCSEPLGPGREKAAHKLIGQFRSSDIENTRDQTLGNQRFHRLSAVARGVEHEYLVAGLLQQLPGTHDTGGGDAEHRGGDQRFVTRGRLLAANVTMPAMARAAVPSTSRLMRLTPKMSTTELSIRMSLSPT